MSWEATAYVSELMRCPDGAPLTSGQKLLLLLLSNRHNKDQREAWPSLKLLAAESFRSLSTVKRDIEYLAAHLVIEQRRPERQGAGIRCSYVFLAMDDPKRLRELLNDRSKGVHGEPLFSADKRGSEGVHPDKKGVHSTRQRGSEGVQNRTFSGGASLLEPEPKPEPKATGTSTPAGAMTEVSLGSATRPKTAGQKALRIWLEVKQAMRLVVGDEEWSLWVRPAYLLKLMGTQVMLIALPPNARIVAAARARLPCLREIAMAKGYNVTLTKYPDEFERERLRLESPEFYEQMFGVKKAANE